MLLLESTQIQPVLGTWAVLLLQPELIKPVVTLGPGGTFFAILAWAVTVGIPFYLNHRATIRAKTAEAWESTARAAQSAEMAAKSEKETWKETAERTGREKLALAEEVGRLRAATDLSVLSKANQEEHKMIVDTLAALQGTIQSVQAAAVDRHERLLTLISENTRAVLGAQSHSANAFETLTEMLKAERARG